LAERGYKVTLLEAQRIGWGASGRNGGQVIAGFGHEGDATIQRQFGKAARSLWDISIEGVSLLKQRITEHKIACDYTDGYLNVAVNEKKFKSLTDWANATSDQYQYPLEVVPSTQMHQFISSDRFHAAVYDKNSGHFHPLKYCLGLAETAKKLGVTIHENSPVYMIARGEKPIVKTALGSVKCDFVILAGNVYLGEYGDRIAPEIRPRIMPVGTYMIATEPMSSSRADALIPCRAAVSDNNFILDYFRLSQDNRLLFGAGDSYSAATPSNLVERIRSRLLNVFPSLTDLKIDYAWGGFVDITMNMAPDIGRVEKNIYYLQGFSGHGVAFTGMAGKLVAEAVAGQAEKFDLFSRLHHYSFPGGELMRKPILMLGALFYQLKDKFY
jgi:gamma-glutamylputrescine oxidase